MAMVCPRCGFAHLPTIVSCEMAKKSNEDFLKRVEHHKLHCDCTDPEGHVRKLESLHRDPRQIILGGV